LISISRQSCCRGYAPDPGADNYSSWFLHFRIPLVEVGE
jgi:hypothetical protein